MHSTLKIGLGPFADYLNGAGSDRIKIVHQQVERITDPDRLAWYPYRRAETGIAAAVASANRREVLQQMVEDAPRNWESNYQELAGGAGRFLDRHRVTRVSTHRATWRTKDLSVTVNHHVGLRYTNGKVYCCFLYMKQPPLTPSMANAINRVLEFTMDETLPGAMPAVLDVRRAKLHKPRAGRNTAKLDTWLQVEAHGYALFWSLAAA